MERTKGKFRYYLDILLSQQAFRIVLLIMVTLRSAELVSIYVGPFVKFTLIWSAAILVKDLFTRRLLLVNRGRGVLYLFLILYGVTTLVHYRENLPRNIAMLGYMTSNLMVIYSYDLSKSREEVKQEIRNLCHTLMIVSLISGIISLVLFVLNIQYRFSHIINGEQKNYWLGFFGGRLWGFISNPNAAGAIALINIMMIFICYVMTNGKMSKNCRRFYILNLIVQAAVFFLVNSRTAWICMVFFILIVPFLLLLSHFHEKRRTETTKKLLQKTTAVSLIALMAFLGIEQTAHTVLPHCSIPTSFFSEQLAQLPNSGDHEDDNAHFSDEIADIEREDYGGVLGGRIYLWHAGVGIIANHPLLGVTTENIAPYAVQYAEWPMSYEEAKAQFEEEQLHAYQKLAQAHREKQLEAIRTGEEPPEDYPPFEMPEYEPYLPGVQSGLHNTVLQIAAASGIPALLLILVFAVSFLVRLIRYFVYTFRRKRVNPLVVAMSGLVLTLLVRSMSETGFIYGIYYLSIVFWSFVSYIMYFIEKETMNDPEFKPGPKPLLAALSDRIFGRRKGR